MNLKDKSDRILALFEHLSFLPRQPIPVEDRDPRLSDVGQLPRGMLFSAFHEAHLNEVTKLYNILHAATDFDDFIKLATQARGIVNEGLYAYALSIAVAERKDCEKVFLPPIQEVFPDRFVPAETINLAIKESKLHPDKDSEIEIVETGNILDAEHKLAYFREDFGINAHHWHWHVVYPSQLHDKIRDRKGELFFYMHQQMCARYDCERLCNGMRRAIPFHNFKEELDGYAPHLTSLVSGMPYASRPSGLSLRDVTEVSVQDLERWRERILNAIDTQHIQNPDGTKVYLDDQNGINLLGALIESSSASLNAAFYGSLHNWGHDMIGSIDDPDGRFKEYPGVMSDTSTSVRDPVFFRWHRFLDNIFQRHKAYLKPYTRENLTFDGIKISSIKVQAKQSNVITTFVNEDRLDLSFGIKFGTGHKVYVKYHHLDHEPFSYVIRVANNSGATKHVTFRVFMAPKYDELGNRLNLEDQRRLTFDMDTFHRELLPGDTVILRNSDESSVTLPNVFPSAQLKAGKGLETDPTEFCSCGWPKHMLVPKGSYKGMEFELFVMATDYTVDNPDFAVKTACSDAFSYCGAKGQKYPDTKPMGFPFDRPMMADSLDKFLTENMSLTEVVIRFTT